MQLVREGDYYTTECWLEIHLKDGNMIIAHAGDLEMVHKAVQTWNHNSSRDTIIVLTGDETLQIRRVEGGTVYISVSLIGWYGLYTPEEINRYVKFHEWVLNIAPEGYNGG